MGQYDLLIGNGCSFTEGGGLNNPQIFEFLTNKKQWGNNHKIFMQQNNWVAYLGEKLDLPWVNLSKSASSDDYIIQRSYDFCNKNLDKKILLINQLSIKERLFFEKDGKPHSYHGGGKNVDGVWFGKLDSEIDNYYKSYITEVFDNDYYYKTLQMKMDLFDAWCEDRLIDNYWITWEPLPFKTETLINFELDSETNGIREWCKSKELLLNQIPNIPVDDAHLSLEGHKEVTNKIYKTITKI